jgi:hypothetical protein
LMHRSRFAEADETFPAGLQRLPDAHELAL